MCLTSCLKWRPVIHRSDCLYKKVFFPLFQNLNQIQKRASQSTPQRGPGSFPSYSRPYILRFVSGRSLAEWALTPVYWSMLQWSTGTESLGEGKFGVKESSGIQTKLHWWSTIVKSSQRCSGRGIRYPSKLEDDGISKFWWSFMLKVSKKFGR